MKIFGITKIRDEEQIIQHTLNAWGGICNGGIYICDENSQDNTVKICEEHSAVKQIKVVEWISDREKAEWGCRQTALSLALPFAKENDWIVYFDADELPFFSNVNLLFDPDIDAIYFKLFDVYITQEDVNKKYIEREYVGSEYRNIVFFFRKKVQKGYSIPDQRVVHLKPRTRIAFGGYIKHYGKGMSIEHWEKTCNYYATYFPKYAEKWSNRKGKAIHNASDFGLPLIKFADVLSGKEKGILM